MTSRKKFALIVIGYVLAFIVAFGTVQIYIHMTNGPDRQTYGAMYDFGDSLLFLGVFGVASIPATALMLSSFRRHRQLWIAIPAIGILISLTGFLALVVTLAPHSYRVFQPWSALSPLRIFSAPLLAIVFILGGILSPIRWSRVTLILIALNEAAIFLLVVHHWRQPI